MRRFKLNIDIIINSVLSIIRMNNEEEKTIMGNRLEGQFEGGNLVPKDSLADSSQVSHMNQSKRGNYSHKFRGDMED